MNMPASRLGPILILALYHDLEEATTGDIPSPIKGIDKDDYRWEAIHEDRYWPPVHDNDFIKDDYKIIKLADNLDAAIFLRREMNLGNKTVQKLCVLYENKVEHGAFELGNEVMSFCTDIMREEDHQEWM